MFFNRKPVNPLNITVDLHSHLLPGVDDGVRTMEEAVATLRYMESLGIKKIYLTPHIKSNIFPNTKDTLYPVFERLQEAVREEGIGIDLRLAAEYYLDAGFAYKLESGERLLTFDDSHVLVESSLSQELLYLHDYIFQLRNHGYVPVLAHPERYSYLHNGGMEVYGRLKKAGCLFQINILSLTGFYGTDVRKKALALVKEGMVDFVGSDIHSERQSRLLADKKLAKILSRNRFNNDIFLK